jgi:hypothetical protein
MPAADVVLLPLCVGLTLLGVIATGVAWRRGNRGRVIQGVGWSLAPVALYFSGLLALLWNGVVAVGRWVSGVILSPPVWFGLGLLALCVVLIVVGRLIARRSPGRKAAKSQGPARKAVAGRSTSASPGSAPAAQRRAEPVDEDLDEIEAILRKRGIQ